MEKTDFEKLRHAYESTMPQMPVDFTGQVMERVTKRSRQHRAVWMLSAAASIVLLVVAGVVFMQQETEKVEPLTAEAPSRSALPLSASQNLPRDAETLGVEASVNFLRKAKVPSCLPRQREALDAVTLADLRHQEVASEVRMTPADSLAELLAHIEEKMLDIRDSCYLVNVEQQIRGDRRLQHLVNRHLLEGILSDTTMHFANIEKN